MDARRFAVGTLVGGIVLYATGQAPRRVGFFLWCSVDFILYGSTNVANLTRTIVDPLVEIIHGGLGGAAIAAALPILSKSANARRATA